MSINENETTTDHFYVCTKDSIKFPFDCKELKINIEKCLLNVADDKFYFRKPEH